MSNEQTPLLPNNGRNKKVNFAKDANDNNSFASNDVESGHCDNENSHNEAHGEKSIGVLASMSIAVNSLAGPAVLQLPFTYQLAGVIPTTCALIFVALLSTFCSLHMANVVSKVQGNSNFDKPIEFSDPFSIFWNRRAYVGTQIVFYLCTICVNIAAIIDTAQVVDSFLGHWIGTYGVTIMNNQVTVEEWIHTRPCSRKKVKLGKCYPFDDEEKYGEYIFTLGYAIAAAVFVPICLMDLKENATGQIFGFLILLATSAHFIFSFWEFGLTFDNVSMWGDSWDSLLGVILFNFTLTLAIPAWLHEKKPSVSVSKIVHGSTVLSTILYILVGLLGAMAIPKVNPNVLEPMVSGAFGTSIRISASIFAFFIIGLDIPLFSVLTRYNLTNSGLCSSTTANILVVYIPWTIGWIFYQGTLIGDLLSWGGVLFTSAVAFILPLYIALRAITSSSNDKGVFESGSISVYGGWLNDSNQGIQTVALKILLGVAVVSVFSAIYGLVSYNEKTDDMLDDPKYVNNTVHQDQDAFFNNLLYAFGHVTPGL